MDNNFKNVTAAIDDSDASDLIVNCLESFNKFGTQKINLVTVVSFPHESEAKEFDTSSQQKRLDNYKKGLENAGFEVTTELRAGTHYYPPVEILQSAEENKSGLIVIGNRGQSRVQELLLGSTATELLQRSDWPVFLINIQIQQEGDDVNSRKFVLKKPCSDALSHVLYPTDFSDNANRAFEVVKALDKKGSIGKVSFIHVQGHHAIALKDPVSRQKLADRNDEQMNSLRNLLTPETREESGIFITFGTPAKEILATAEEQGATMFIMGSQGRGFVRDFFLGGVSNYVTRYSNIPVLLIPAERE